MKVESVTIEVVLIGRFEVSAVKSAVHRGYDKLLCNHAYCGFCQNCPQYKCGRRHV